MHMAIECSLMSALKFNEYKWLKADVVAIVQLDLVFCPGIMLR